jgi:hypothetical protein
MFNHHIKNESFIIPQNETRNEAAGNIADYIRLTANATWDLQIIFVLLATIILNGITFVCYVIYNITFLG